MGKIRRFNSPRGAVVVSVIVLMVSLATWAVRVSRLEARLVQTEADSATSEVSLMRFALPRGKEIYERRCANCHGRRGEGDTTLGFPNLTDQDWLYGEGNASDIESVVMYGIRAPHSGTWHLADMPGYALARPYPRDVAIKPLEPDAIVDLIQYLRTVEGRSANSDAARRGSQTFQNAGCYDCHGVNAEGDAAIGAPNLTDNIWLYGDGTDQWLYDSIAQGRAGVCPGWANRLPARDIREVALYVYSLSHRAGLGISPNHDAP